MPRRSRVDAPGALHHIIARGIERTKIFRDDPDRNNFLERLGGILKETKTPCLAWALMPSHIHLLLRTGQTPLATLMRRLLTGYAVTFNRRHRRYGYLFQNRYKSILCQEEPYLLELVRYIHLNPIRGGFVEDMEGLAKYPFSGHSAILGGVKRDWQDTRGVLDIFDERRGVARRQYRTFIQEGIALGRRPELTGGGFIRSHGGWAAVKAMRRAREFQKSDERILGDGVFVEKVLAIVQESKQRKYPLWSQGIDLERIIERAAGLMGVEPSLIWQSGKERNRVSARSLICYWTVRHLGISLAALSRRSGLSLSGVSQSVKRGEELANARGYNFLEIMKLQK
jgi:putative transposase